MYSQRSSSSASAVAQTCRNWWQCRAAAAQRRSAVALAAQSRQCRGFGSSSAAADALDLAALRRQSWALAAAAQRRQHMSTFSRAGRWQRQRSSAAKVWQRQRSVGSTGCCQLQRSGVFTGQRQRSSAAQLGSAGRRQWQSSSAAHLQHSGGCADVSNWWQRSAAAAQRRAWQRRALAAAVQLSGSAGRWQQQCSSAAQGLGSGSLACCRTRSGRSFAQNTRIRSG